MILRSLKISLLVLPLRLASCADAPLVEIKGSAIVETKFASEQQIALARAAVERQPKNAEARNALAFALVRHARDVSDPKFYEPAAEAQKESLRLAPDNFEARKIEVMVSLGRHEYVRALSLARSLNRLRPDDVLVYSLLADACIETGNYDEAEKAAQWALDMRPGEICGLVCTARLREIFGDLQGAIDLVQAAYAKTAPGELGDRAWLLAQFAHLQILNRQPGRADAAIDDALKLWPGHPAALRQRVSVRTLQKRPSEAVAFARELCNAAPNPVNFFVLGTALLRAGEAGESRKVLADFAQRALGATIGNEANQELVFYYSDHAHRPEEALRIADLEIGRRQDVHTRDARAWALCANGKFEDAGMEMEKVLAIGIREPAIFYRAGLIAAKRGRPEQAQGYLQESLETAGESDVSALARAALAQAGAEKAK